MRRIGAAAPLAALLACAAGPPRPATLDTRNESCRLCRMIVSDPRYAAQIVAPGEEPLFFDDIGCLRSFVRGEALKPGAVVFVADRRTKEWVPAARAVYTKGAGLQTPMGSQIVAHADSASRAADRDAAGGAPLTAADVFGPGGLPGEGR